MNCPIDKGIAFDCSTLPQGGVEATVIRINFDDYRQAKIDGGITVDPVSGEITAITLPTGKQGYEIKVPKGSNIIATSPLRRVSGIDGYDHTTDIRAATIEKNDLDNISKTRFNKVVDIVILSEGRSKVYGGNVGMRISEYDVSDGDSDTSATVRFLSKTDDKEAPEVHIPDLIASSFDLSTLLTPAT